MTESLKFLHAIDLYGQWTCQYIVQSGGINSLLQLGFWTSLPIDFHQCSLDDLRDNADVVFEKASSPRAQIMIHASLIRKGVALKLDGIRRL